ncbi:MAG: hypothetical protein ACMXYE_02500 [Candidatus Woesearchaeota archaeon]
MSTQISLKLSDKMNVRVKSYSERLGYDSVQDFIENLAFEI